MESYIRQAAAARGIDPDIAIKVARSEGLRENTWQGNSMLAYGRERSYGPFQLHVAPEGYRGGMGNDFIRATGLDPSDPANWKRGVDFALDQAKSGGWSPWFGAKKVGVTGMMGIGGTPVPADDPPYSAGRGRGSMAGYRKAPGTYSGGQYVPPQDITFYADNSPALPGNDGNGAGASIGGFVGGPAQVAARTGVVVPASASGDMRPTNFQQMMARQAMEGDQSQRERLLKATGLDPTGKRRLTPREASTGILGGLQNQTGAKLDAAIAQLPATMQQKLHNGILGKLFNLFG